MPFYPKSFFGTNKMRQARKSRPRFKRRLAKTRSGFGGRGVRTFTETFYAGEWFANASGKGALIQCKMDDLDEVNQQSALQTQYCIKKMKVIIVPKYTSFDRNSATQNNLLTPALPQYGSTRIVTSVQDSGNAVAPTSEIEALDDNGSKIRMLGDRPMYLGCYPKPLLKQASPNGDTSLLIATNQKAQQWIGFDGGGSAVVHNGIATWTTLNVGGYADDLPVGDFQIKITFSVRDPR